MLTAEKSDQQVAKVKRLSEGTVRRRRLQSHRRDNHELCYSMSCEVVYSAALKEHLEGLQISGGCEVPAEVLTTVEKIVAQPVPTENVNFVGIEGSDFFEEIVINQFDDSDAERGRAIVKKRNRFCDADDVDKDDCEQEDDQFQKKKKKDCNGSDSLVAFCPRPSRKSKKAKKEAEKEKILTCPVALVVTQRELRRSLRSTHTDFALGVYKNYVICGKLGKGVDPTNFDQVYAHFHNKPESVNLFPSLAHLGCLMTNREVKFSSFCFFLNCLLGIYGMETLCLGFQCP